MQTILIVDDERIEREGIQLLIHRYFPELQTLLAENGEAAFELLQKQHVDILFTDIKMPFMDGLELAERASKWNADLIISIYSAFGEFDYAKRALRTNATSYLLKPIQVAEFRKVMEESITLCSSRQAKRKEHEKLLDGYNRGIAYEKEKVLLDALNGSCSQGMEMIKDEYRGHYIQLVLIDFSNNFFDKHSSEFLQRITVRLPWAFDNLNLNENQSLIFLKDTQKIDLGRLRLVCQEILDDSANYYGMEACLIIGEQVERWEELPRAFNDIEQTLDYKFFFEGSILLVAGERLHTANTLVSLEVNELLERVNQCVSYNDKHEMKQSIDVLFTFLKNKGQLSVIYTKFICSELMRKILSNLKWDRGDLIPERLEQIFHANSLHEVRDILLHVVDQLMQMPMTSAQEQGTNKIVLQVKEIVEQQYMKDLTLGDIAEKVYLNPSYLSYLFKKETGISLVRYVTSFRLAKAADLLSNSSMKVIDIGEKLGYSNPSYFIQIFKNHFGVSPAKFREIQR